MNRYKVNRIGFVNFWLYDEEDFYFYDGKLLLRGTNGSGKTVTMQSFFPLIFDGNKSPERLDPFGSRDRKIEDYLLPNDFVGNENTGYLYMEFLDKQNNQYITIGLGIKAIRNRGCESWGFAITDNRRMGEDFLLFKERNLRIPLTKKELQTRIGTGGEFAETMKDYKKMVNKLLFGFKNMDLYTEFINLLIQVRSPKLSNSTRPSQLTGILSSVLEPLSEEDLRIMADSIESINKYKEKLNDLNSEQKAANSLKKFYQDYNNSILYSKGNRFLELKQNYQTLENEIRQTQTEMQKLLEHTNELKETIKELQLEEVKLTDQKDKLEQTDLKTITHNLDEILERIKDLEDKKQIKNQEYEQKQNNLLNCQKDLKKRQDELDKIDSEFQELIKDLTDYEEDIKFDDAKFYLDDLKKEKLEFKQMTSYVTTVQKRLQLLNILKEIAFCIESKEKEIEEEKNNYEIQNDELKKIEREKNNISQKLSQLLTDLKASIAKTSENNHALKLAETDLHHIYEIIDNLENEMFIKIKEQLKTKVYELKDNLQMSISNSNIKMNEYENKIDKLKQELNKIETILTNSLEDDEVKNYLKERNISYEYFFNTIDFKENIEEKVRRQIESFLYETGVLTAFVTNEEIENSNVRLKCLQARESVSNNLSKYVVALDTPFQEKVKKIIESISLEEKHSIKILENGKYEFALFKGNVDINHELRFIGKKVQENYKNKEKEKIEIAIKSYTKEIEDIKKNIEEKKKDINIIEEEFNNYIFPGEIEESFKTLNKLDIQIETSSEIISKITETIQEKLSEVKEIEEKFENQRKEYYGSNKYEYLNTIYNDTHKYLKILEQLSNCFKEFISKTDLVNYCKVRVEEIQNDISIIISEMEEIEKNLIIGQNKKQNIDEILNSDKYKDVGKEYERIKSRLDIIKDEIPTKRDMIVKNETTYDNKQEAIENKNKELEKIKVLKNVAYQILLDEYNLHYIKSEDFNLKELEKLIIHLKPSISSREIEEKLNENVNKYSQYLINYAPKNIYLHTPGINNYLNFTNDETLKDEINKMFDDAIRKDFVFNYSGKTINLLELTMAIDNSIQSYDNLITEENEKLFRDLLVNNIGESIRTKIWESEEWIKEVKNLMESMNTSSGLKFSLKWSGNQAKTEEELDTLEIVNIFKQDALKLKPEHFEKFRKHFESKINMKEEALEESEKNYLEIIKEVLDYRKWFEFKLYVQRGNGEKKELTDREFNKMSGGEKAIAMYVPLFASIFAKLKSAENVKAPHIIALDEAFAGVDDENIKDAFRILEQLDIDYVLTSQQLWGDYETVKHLAISELHHPVGSDVVSIIKYKWDGIKRSKINDYREYEV